MITTETLSKNAADLFNRLPENKQCVEADFRKVLKGWEGPGFVATPIIITVLSTTVAELNEILTNSGLIVKEIEIIIDPDEDNDADVEVMGILFARTERDMESAECAMIEFSEEINNV